MRKLTTNQIALLQTLDRAHGRPAICFGHEARQSLARLANRGLVFLDRAGFYDVTKDGLEALHKNMFAST